MLGLQLVLVASHMSFTICNIEQENRMCDTNVFYNVVNFVICNNVHMKYMSATFFHGQVKW
jgi:hypothetical protein